MKKYFILIIFLIGQIYSYCQTYGGENDIVKSTHISSPTASELGKYGSYPVSYYTGTVAVSVPLVDFTAEGFSLPIYLSYHTSGIRVDDISPWTGLGWSLNAGGVISINVKGLQDICVRNINNEPDDLLLDCYDRSIHFTQTQIEELIGQNSDPYKDVLDDLHHVSIDSEPDIYNYNFAGYQGQFLVNFDGEIVFFGNHNGLSGTVNFEDYSITLIDDLGRKYYFATFEITDSFQNGLGLTGEQLLPHSHFSKNLELTMSALYLTKIEIENSSYVINFEYRDESFYKSDRVSGFNSTRQFNQYWEITSPHDQSRFYYLKHHLSVKRIKEINDTKGNKVVFNEELENNAYAQRDDIDGVAYPLREINYYIYGELKSKYELKYEYFISNINQESINSKRLKLKSVRKIDINDNSFPPYVFEYYGESNNESHLRLPPRRCYTGIDYWGYCNDNIDISKLDIANDARSILPVVNSTNANPDIPYLFHESTRHTRLFGIRNYHHSISLPDYVHGTSKEANGVYATSFSLKKIYYPTGGHTSFEFEGNTYGKVQNNYRSGVCGGIRIKKVIDDPGNGHIPIVKTYEYGNGMSSGILLAEPSVFSAALDHQYDYLPAYEVYLNASSINPLTDYDGAHIGYGLVKEIMNNAYTVYSYLTIADILDENIYDIQKVYHSLIWGGSITEGAPAWKFAGYTIDYDFSNKHRAVQPFNNRLWLKYYSKGMLKSKTEKINNIIAHKTLYNYNIYEKDKIYSNKVQKRIFYPWRLPVNGEIQNCFMDYWLLQSYYLQTGRAFLSSKEEINYTDNGDALESVYTEYIFDEEMEILKETSTNFRNGNLERTYYYYPFDYKDNSNITEGIAQMNVNNMLRYPIETIKTINNKVISANVLTYDIYEFSQGNIIKPSSGNYAAITTPIPYSSFEKYEGGLVNSPYITEVFADSYDYKGNITQLHGNYDINKVILWGYNFVFPIAKIENANFNEVIGALGMSYFDLQFKNSSELKSIFNDLRASLSNANIYSYTYDPMVGVTSETDLNGKITQFSYDSFNRLETIIDEDLNLLKHIDYNNYNHITVKPQRVLLSESSGSSQIEVNTDFEWTTSENIDWLTITSSSSNNGNGVISFDYNDNLGLESRYGHISVFSSPYNETVLISQIAEQQLDAYPLSFLFSPNSGSKNINIISNVDWQIIEFPGWIQPSQITGTGSVLIDILCQENNSSQERSGILKISGVNDLEITISITQMGQ